MQGIGIFEDPAQSYRSKLGRYGMSAGQTCLERGNSVLSHIYLSTDQNARVISTSFGQHGLGSSEFFGQDLAALNAIASKSIEIMAQFNHQSMANSLCRLHSSPLLTNRGARRQPCSTWSDVQRGALSSHVAWGWVFWHTVELVSATRNASEGSWKWPTEDSTEMASSKGLWQILKVANPHTVLEISCGSNFSSFFWAADAKISMSSGCIKLNFAKAQAALLMSCDPYSSVRSKACLAIASIKASFFTVKVAKDRTWDMPQLFSQLIQFLPAASLQRPILQDSIHYWPHAALRTPQVSSKLPSKSYPWHSSPNVARWRMSMLSWITPEAKNCPLWPGMHADGFQKRKIYTLHTSLKTKQYLPDPQLGIVRSFWPPPCTKPFEVLDFYSW